MSAYYVWLNLAVHFIEDKGQKLEEIFLYSLQYFESKRPFWGRYWRKFQKLYCGASALTKTVDN